MELKHYSSVQEFLKENETILLENEALNSLLFGLCIGNVQKENDNTLYIDISDEQGIFFTGIKTENKNLILNGNIAKIRNAVPLLLDFIKQENISIPGIVGPKDLVLEIAKTLEHDHQWSYSIAYEQLVYELKDIKYNPEIKGKLKQETTQNIEHIAKWFQLFLREALNEKISFEEALSTAKNKIEKGQVYSWNTDTGVAMACTARPTRNGITVNYVFTPKDHRRHGYGTKLVAELSKLKLVEGYTFCTLFTDMTNPTSNSIYTKIGYKPIGEFRVITFE